MLNDWLEGMSSMLVMGSGSVADGVIIWSVMDGVSSLTPPLVIMENWHLRLPRSFSIAYASARAAYAVDFGDVAIAQESTGVLLLLSGCR